MCIKRSCKCFFVCDVETKSRVETGENAGYQHLLYFPLSFQSITPQGKDLYFFASISVNKWTINLVQICKLWYEIVILWYEMVNAWYKMVGSGISGIPHFRNNSPKLSDIVRDKSPTWDHVVVLFKIRLIFHTLGSLGSRNINKTHTRKRTF